MCLRHIVLFRFCGHVEFEALESCQDEKDRMATRGVSHCAYKASESCNAAYSLTPAMRDDGCSTCNDIEGLRATFNIRKEWEFHYGIKEHKLEFEQTHNPSYYTTWLESGWRMELFAMKAVKLHYKLDLWEDVEDRYLILRRASRFLDLMAHFTKCSVEGKAFEVPEWDEERRVLSVGES
jgi:hypothetical protein